MPVLTVEGTAQCPLPSCEVGSGPTMEPRAGVWEVVAQGAQWCRGREGAGGRGERVSASQILRTLWLQTTQMCLLSFLKARSSKPVSRG